MRRIDTSESLPLLGTAATRALERQLANSCPRNEPMSRAGKSIAQLALALTPHARCIWVACGSGNNGGDGLIAATHLQGHALKHGTGLRVAVSLCGEPGQRSPEATRALGLATSAGIDIRDAPPPSFDLAIDALLGLGASRAPTDRMARQLVHMHSGTNPVLSVDLPSGLLADTGQYLGPAPLRGRGVRHTLAFLGLQPGLFMGQGRDMAGEIWLDDLGAGPFTGPNPAAFLSASTALIRPRTHASHKGEQGDVVVIGGQDIEHSGAGMTGAAVLAARAALYSGAGRVYLGLLTNDGGATRWDPICPELMLRRVDMLLGDHNLMARAGVVCGCGGGSEVKKWLPPLLSTCHSLVLDADALNAIAGDLGLRTLTRQRAQQGWTTVITPHPLEAARLLHSNTPSVMADRLSASIALADDLGAICVLKGSGTVVAAPGRVPIINASGNAALATAGTGDVLAGMLGTALAGLDSGQDNAIQAVANAVQHHGAAADTWNSSQQGELSASRLAHNLRHLR